MPELSLSLEPRHHSLSQALSLLIELFPYKRLVSPTDAKTGVQRSMNRGELYKAGMVHMLDIGSRLQVRKSPSTLASVLCAGRQSVSSRRPSGARATCAAATGR